MRFTLCVLGWFFFAFTYPEVIRSFSRVLLEILMDATFILSTLQDLKELGILKK